jgi:hypothetical protein
LAVTAAVPDTCPRKVEVQVADAVVPLRLQVVNVPPVIPVSVSATVPVGVVVGAPVATSVTVTVQVEPWLATTGVVQETVVVVGCLLTNSETVAVPVPAALVAFTRTVNVPLNE